MQQSQTHRHRHTTQAQTHIQTHTRIPAPHTHTTVDTHVSRTQGGLTAVKLATICAALCSFSTAATAVSLLASTSPLTCSYAVKSCRGWGMHHMMVWGRGKAPQDSLPCTSHPLCGGQSGTHPQDACIPGPAEPTCTSKGGAVYVHVTSCDMHVTLCDLHVTSCDPPVLVLVNGLLCLLLLLLHFALNSLPELMALQGHPTLQLPPAQR